MSIGQELSATPLQVLRMAAAVANDGVLPQPYIVDGDAQAGKRVISEAAATMLGLILERVVTHGTGKAARIPGYRVAGKTGTAQKAVPSGGYGEEHVASFVGYVPARRPALAMVVVLDSPQGLYHGGDVAAPVFARVALPALRHLGILPDEGAIDAPPARPAPILTAAAPRRAALPLRRTGDGDPVVPDLAGATLRAALARLARAGLSARADGNGRVVGQVPPPGQVLPRGAMVRLLLKEPAPAANAAPDHPGRNGSRAGAR
jgi:membrane peptidoglycan carboxypeptidase